MNLDSKSVEVNVKNCKIFIGIYAFLLTSLITSYAYQLSGTVTILHTNDMHSQYVSMPATWVQKEPKPQIGGMVALEYFIRQAKQTFKATILIDAGDIMTGTPIAKMMIDGALGGGFVQMMNQIGYDAMTLGNHEFDEGQANLFCLIKLVKFDVLSANLFIGSELLTKKPYAIYVCGNLRIGVIGLTLMDLFDVTAKKNLEGIRVENPAPLVQKIIDEIDGKTDLIILLTHQGVDADIELAQRLQNADVIVGGHSHTRLNKPIVKNSIIIVQADNKTRYLGRLTVDVQEDRVVKFDYKLIPTWADSVRQPDAGLQMMVASLKEYLDRDYGQFIGTLQSDWMRNNQGESSIGNFISDVIKDILKVDFAVINSGGIRKNMTPGPIKKLDIVEILPFSNYLVTFTCTGQQLLSLIRTNARAAAKNEPGILQVSGLRYKYRIMPNRQIEILSATINGHPIEENKEYRGATVDFVLFGQAEKYFGFTPQEKGEATNMLLSDIVIGYISDHPDVSTKVDNRIQQLP